MGDIPHKPLPKLRTFQIDQAHARGDVSVPITKKDPLPTPSVSAPKITVTASKKAEPAPPPKKPAAVTPSVTPPAFHELKEHAHKKIEHIIAKETAVPAKTVTVRDKKSAPRSFAAEATVITSAKKSDFNFFEAVSKSFKEWLQGFGKNDTTPKYTVSTVDRRKGLIQKATTSTGALFTSDTISIKEEITRKREDQTEKEPHDIHLSWSPKTEPVFTLLEEPHKRLALPEKKPVTVHYKKKSIPPPQIIEPVIASSIPKRAFTPPTDAKVPQWESDSITTPDSPYAPSVYTPPAPTAPVMTPPPVFKVPERIIPSVPQPPPVVHVRAPQAPAITTVTPPATVPLPAPQAPLSFTKPGTSIPTKPNPKTSYLRRGLRELFRFDTTVATVVAVGSIISFVMVFLIVKTLVGMIMPTSTPSIIVSEAMPLTPAGEVIDVAISAPTKEALVSALQSQQRPADAVVEFRIVEADGTPLSASTFWQLLEFNSDSSLARALTEVRIGYTDGNYMLVFTATDTTTVFGALLTWEQLMGEEVLPLFKEDPTSVTSVTDETAANSDVRVIKNGSEVVLVYGFINKNTVVITESLEAYQATVEN